MSNSNSLFADIANSPGMPDSELGMLPARLTKWLCVDPQEFLQTTDASQIAGWAIFASKLFIVALPIPPRRGPKQVYRDSSILMLAYIQVAWQMGYEMVVDYFRAHPAAAQAAGFVNGTKYQVFGHSGFLYRHGCTVDPDAHHSRYRRCDRLNNSTGLVSP